MRGAILIMKKVSTITLLSFCLLLAISFAVYADPGFKAGLGYEDLNNELTIATPDGELEVNSPCPMYFVEVGYDFGNNLMIDAKYAKCVADQTLAAFDSPILAAEIATDSDTDLFSIEAAFQKELGSFKLKGIIGYLESDYERTLAGRIFEASGGVDVERSVSGTYLGGAISYAPNDRFQVGAAYRWMIDPDIELQAADYSFDVSDPEASQLEIFAQTALTGKLSLKASYSVSWIEYDISEVNVENETDGLALKLQYQF